MSWFLYKRSKREIIYKNTNPEISMFCVEM